MKEIIKVPYTSFVGSLMYAMVYTRSDITHTVGVVSISWLVGYSEDKKLLV